MGRRENAGTSCNVKCCIAVQQRRRSLRRSALQVTMSQQLTLSSLFCVLALAGLCVVTGTRELAGFDAPVIAEQVSYLPERTAQQVNDQVGRLQAGRSEATDRDVIQGEGQHGDGAKQYPGV